MVVLHVAYYADNEVTLPASLANITLWDGVNLTFRANSSRVVASRYHSFRRGTEHCEIAAPACILSYRLLSRLKTTKK